MNSKETVEAAEKVIEFAKSLGFDKATMAIWDVNETEHPQESFEEMAFEAELDEECEAQIGIFLNKNVFFGYLGDVDAAEEELIWDPKV